MENDSTTKPRFLERLNPAQREAATHGDTPLLIVAGAGTGKTATLVHRVAWHLHEGVDPSRILLLTFTRRAAAEMVRRVDAILGTKPEDDSSAGSIAGRVWGGTFHAIATRLLRIYGETIGLPPDFTILDRTDSEDLMGALRTELALPAEDKRFPKKGTCMSIYSRTINAQARLRDVLEEHFPWCKNDRAGLKKLFDAYVDRKASTGVLDYDDLLLYLDLLLQDENVGARVRRRFDCVLVDEYQDTNILQASILRHLCPQGRGLTVVGDDAQSIYSFRAATVRNILDFPKQYDDATVIPLEQNYRSSQPILDASNGLLEQLPEAFAKRLWSENHDATRPYIVSCQDDDEQVNFVIQRVLAHREEGMALQRQAVLFRASHHSALLETELSRRGIPFQKYGGLRFVDAAHVKDLLCHLRLAENPRDGMAGMRALQLIPGIGPKKAMQLVREGAESADPLDHWRQWKAPKAAGEYWGSLLALLDDVQRPSMPVDEQVEAARRHYTPLLEQKYDNPSSRAADLEQLVELAARYPHRRELLTELTLDPPSTTEDLAGPPHLDEEFLILSTIHSAKGLEWDAVYVIHAADGNIPSDMSTGDESQVAEELRLLYVAMTRARRRLYVCWPLRYYHHPARRSDNYGWSKPSRFLTQAVQAACCCIRPGENPDEAQEDESKRRVDLYDLLGHASYGRPTKQTQAARDAVRASVKSLWDEDDDDRDMK